MMPDEDMEDRLSGSIYESEHLKFLEEVAFLEDIREYLTDVINRSRLSQSGKNAYISLVETMFTQNTVLSMQRSPEIPECKLEIALLIARANCRRPDVKKPTIIQIEELIRDVFFYVIPRTIGKERERLLQIPTLRKEEIVTSTQIEKAGENTSQRGWIWSK
jgi:hypothetical protein